MRRPKLLRMVWPTLMLFGAPAVEKPARRGLKVTASFRLSLTMSGSSRSSKKRSSTSSRESANWKLSSASPPSWLGAATSAAARGLGNTVARGEFLVAGQDIFTLAIARGMAEGRFARIARRHGHGVCALHVGDLASLDVLLYCPLQLLLRPLEEAPAVADALVLRIKPTIDEIRHEPLSGAPGSARLVDPHVPIYQPAHLSFSIAASGHALDKFGMLLFR